ncbi:AAA family ATPase [Salmonella enterica subsp. enterica serovar Typhimurium]|nr:AAA family ATPase [Salmonella enterica subsp. enterica serovar Typhimurium]ECM7049758.1 AAA family ATPase [Salmonella enterica subsp. enterica serovar Typhimurium]EEN8705754.1 AAA family ATPase [Salmonella enterica subsp. enterica serovar Typhimurium]
MSNYCFYSQDALALAQSAGVDVIINSYAEQHKKQTYILCRPLSNEDVKYDYDRAIAVFSSGIKPFFIDFGDDDDLFEEYQEDFLEDVSYLAEKFKYRDKIGRKKSWQILFESLSRNDIDFKKLEVETKESRVIDLIISLIVGSINDTSRINLEANNLLDTIKSKIILFDTDQTKFVFQSGFGKKSVIQGLAGSGKTELLLHKLKEIYSKNPDSRIAFTCFNKTLASTMRTRIPEFFDFMRVEKQIEWGTKLFCFNSWGLTKEPFSGMYRYICHYYEIPFGGFGNGDFDALCKKAIADINNSGRADKKALDYVFIDESQDFPQSFIDLCEMVTSKKLYVAGDVFQNIFMPISDNVNRADIVLKKCYRTDPKNLMFSHALGMGLYEEPVLRWLKEPEWDSCGYKYKKVGDRVHLSRDPLRRFEDIPKNHKSTAVHLLEGTDNGPDKIVDIIIDIKERNPSLEQGDIAVIFLDAGGYIYEYIHSLKSKVKQQLGWDSNISHETKSKQDGKLFISNINNAKGLEFPFVICFAMKLVKRANFRNALYTMMARSFLESHLVLNNDNENPAIPTILEGLNFLNENNYMDVRLPSDEEIQSQKDFIVLDESVSISQMVKSYCADKKSTPRLIAKITDRVERIIAEDDDADGEYIKGLIEIEYERNKKL